MTFGSYAIQYDANGNMTNLISGTTTNRLVWSPRNQLTNMTGAVTANFLYDGLGRRITRTVAGTTERYLYDGLDIILQKNSGGTVQARYLRGLAIDEPWQRIDIGTANTNRVYLADALGSIVALTDTNKAITTEYDYEPFGKSVVSGQSSVNSYRFTAREDDGTGLMYYRARYYHPVLGRFVSEDPLDVSSIGEQRYAYVRNRPLNSLDPIGLLDGFGFAVGHALQQTEAKGYQETIARGDPFVRYNPLGAFNAAEAAERKHFGRTPDPHGGAYRHCVAACLLGRAYGNGIASTLVAIWDRLHEDPSDANSRGDMAGEQEGLRCAQNSKKPCDQACLGSYPVQ